MRAILLGHEDLEERNSMEDLSLKLPSDAWTVNNRNISVKKYS